MAATNRLFVDAVSGTTDADPGVTDPGTLSGAFLADLPVVADPDFVALTLDPEEANGAYEIVWVTAHSTSATTATIARAKEGTSARAHPSGTKVVAALTDEAIAEFQADIATAQTSADSHAARHAGGAADPLTAGGISLSMLVAAVQEALVPVGSIVAHGGGSTPSGYLPCDGGQTSRTTYADLFNVIGTTYGAGDGSTTFNRPDLRSRFPLGASGDPNPPSRGQTGGAFDHTHDQTAHTHGLNGTGAQADSVGGHAHSNPSTDSAGAHSHTMGTHAHTMGTHIHTMGTHAHTFSDSFTTGTESTSTVTAAFGTESPGLAQDSHTHSGSVSGSTSAVDPGNTGATDPGDTGATDPGNTSTKLDHAHSQGVTSSSGGHNHAVSGSTQSGAASGSTDPTGASNPPYLGVNYIIKY